MREKPVPIDLLVDTHCRPIIARLDRATELLNTVCKCLRHSGKMTPHEISLILQGLSSRWSGVERNDVDEEGAKIKKEPKTDG